MDNFCFFEGNGVVAAHIAFGDIRGEIYAPYIFAQPQGISQFIATVYE